MWFTESNLKFISTDTVTVLYSPWELQTNQSLPRLSLSTTCLHGLNRLKLPNKYQLLIWVLSALPKIHSQVIKNKLNFCEVKLIKLIIIKIPFKTT